jgi:uncharacterized protein with GYD domain
LEAPLPLYLSRFNYTAAATKALLAQPQDRSVAAREVAESLGGKLVGFWYAFGEFDGVFLMEAPDSASAAAVAMAIGASGALSDVETTVLLDMDEAQDAMRKAAAATYRPPGS